MSMYDSPQVSQLRPNLLEFMDEFIYPHERTHQEQLRDAADRWQPLPIMEELKLKALAAGALESVSSNERVWRRPDES